MTVSPSGVNEIAAFVHTHGARLVRLAHLLGVADPASAVADAMASTLLRGGRRRDAHDELLEAARAVGSQRQPPVREDARLQGWLDRAEAAAYEIDLEDLRHETARRLEVQRGQRSSTRRRAAVGTIAAVLLVAGISVVAGDDDTAARQPDGFGGLRSTGEPPASDGPAPTGLPSAGSFLLPRQLQSANGVVVADVLLQGPALPIARVDVAIGSATMIAVEGVTRGGSRVVCVLAVPDGQSLLQADAADLVGVIPAPQEGRLLTSGSPLTVRQSVVEDYRGLNLMFDVTSSRVDNAVVTLADGRQIIANRYSTTDSDIALFVTVDDTAAAEISYLSSRRGQLRAKSLYTATP